VNPIGIALAADRDFTVLKILPLLIIPVLLFRSSAPTTSCP
jgi:hypothetical protein